MSICVQIVGCFLVDLTNLGLGLCNFFQLVSDPTSKNSTYKVEKPEKKLNSPVHGVGRAKDLD